MNMQAYMQNPQTKQQMDAYQASMIQEIENGISYDLNRPCLSKDDALKHIRFMEEQKMDAVKNLQQKTRGQMIQQ